MQKQSNTFKLIETSLYAALIIVAIYLIRIPMPSAISNSFVHPGNALVALSILLMGFKRGVTASSIGLFIFDVTAGYAAEAIFTVMESVLVLIIMQLVYNSLFKKHPSKKAVVTLGIVAAVSKVIIIFIEFLIQQLALGNPFDAAFAMSLSGMPASLFTAMVTAILVPILFLPMSKVMERYHPIGE